MLLPADETEPGGDMGMGIGSMGSNGLEARLFVGWVGAQPHESLGLFFFFFFFLID